MHFSHLYPHLFQVNQAALIRNDKRKALILQRADGYWTLPETALALGEAWLDSLARGIFDATKIENFKVGQLLGADNWEEFGETHYYVVFECETTDKEIARLSNSGRIYAWVDAETASQHIFYHPKVKEHLVATLSRAPQPITHKKSKQ